MLLFHAGVRWYPRPWYFVPNAAAFAVGFALILKSDRQRQWVMWVLTGLILLGFLLSGTLIWQTGLYPWQREMFQAAKWIVINLPESGRVGSYNSGIYSYYWDGVVVNLDGVVNHQAFESIRQRREICYMVEEELDYLIDYDSAIHREYEPFLGDGYPELLIESEVLGGDPSGPLGLLRVYRIDRSNSVGFCTE
jgi:hypothetical protein